TPASGRLNAVIDIKHLAENPELYRASQRAREDDESLVDQIIAVDSERRAALQAFENLRAEQNALSKKIGPASGEEKQALLAQAKELSANVKAAQHRPMPKTNNLTSSITSSRTLLSKVSHPVTKTTSQSSKKSASCPISILHPATTSN